SLVVRAHDESVAILSVRESRQTQKPGDIRGCRIAAISRGQSPQKGFRLVRVEAFDAPHDLMFSGRSIENEIWRRYVARGADRLKRSTSLLVQVQIGVTYVSDMFFCPVSRPFFNGIHANEDVGSGQILHMKPGLKPSTRDCLCRKDPLQGLLSYSIPDEHCSMVARLVNGEHVFRRRQKSRRE